VDFGYELACPHNSQTAVYFHMAKGIWKAKLQFPCADGMIYRHFIKTKLRSSKLCKILFKPIMKYGTDAWTWYNRQKWNKHRRREKKFTKNFSALVRQRTIPTERPPLVGEVNSNFS
jgi:hypothetical protein